MDFSCHSMYVSTAVWMFSQLLTHNEMSLLRYLHSSGSASVVSIQGDFFAVLAPVSNAVLSLFLGGATVAHTGRRHFLLRLCLGDMEILRHRQGADYPSLYILAFFLALSYVWQFGKVCLGKGPTTIILVNRSFSPSQFWA